MKVAVMSGSSTTFLGGSHSAIRSVATRVGGFTVAAGAGALPPTSAMSSS
ncbi:hypothetical protein ACFSTC_04260 [Nonomuraea ferruginea]